MSAKNQIKTTGQLREMLAKATQDVLDGSLEIEKALTIHKLAKNISESLYSETKISMFAHEIGGPVQKMGDLPLGSSNS